MKICFIGLGSMGSRHLYNMNRLLQERGISCSFDAVRSSERAISPSLQNLIGCTWSNTDDMPDDYDIVFVTNPTHLHYQTIKAVLNKTRHIFIEKPVFDKPGLDWENLPWRLDGVYYVACPLRYHRVTEWVKDFVEHNPVYAVRALCSSYLPEWRPDTDYRTCYSANAEMGGGVRIDLIHEWDYLSYLFGPPIQVSAMWGQYSNLEITSEDIALYIARYTDKLVSLQLDYFGRANRREVELLSGNEVVVGDYVKQEIRFLRSGKHISLAQTRDEMHLAELGSFLNMLVGSQMNHNPVEVAAKTLTLALGGT